MGAQRGGVRKRREVKRGKPEEYPRDVAEFYATLPPKPDWEALIEAGTVPALILGAERRQRRGNS